MIDPQGQANRWIRNMEGTKLRIIDLKMAGYLREVENAVQYGFPVLLQDILEDIDSSCFLTKVLTFDFQKPQI
jgi:dynein heavy chain